MTGRSATAATAIRLIPDHLAIVPIDAAATRWLRVEPAHLIARHRWIRLRYSSSFFEDPIRPLIRFVTRTGAVFIQAMNGPVLGSAEWTGRVPDKTMAIAISPGRGGGPMGFRIDRVTPVSRLTLLGRGALHDCDLRAASSRASNRAAASTKTSAACCGLSKVLAVPLTAVGDAFLAPCCATSGMVRSTDAHTNTLMIWKGLARVCFVDADGITVTPMICVA